MTMETVTTEPMTMETITEPNDSDMTTLDIGPIALWNKVQEILSNEIEVTKDYTDLWRNAGLYRYRHGIKIKIWSYIYEDYILVVIVHFKNKDILVRGIENMNIARSCEQCVKFETASMTTKILSHIFPGFKIQYLDA